jgi:hypothetical protein
MKKVIRLTENELAELIEKIIVETEMGMEDDTMEDNQSDEK